MLSLLKSLNLASTCGLSLPVLWFHPFLDSKESQCMANGRQVSNTDISSAYLPTKDSPLVSCAILHADLRLSVESAERLYISALIR